MDVSKFANFYESVAFKTQELFRQKVDSLGKYSDGHGDLSNYFSNIVLSYYDDLVREATYDDVQACVAKVESFIRDFDPDCNY